MWSLLGWADDRGERGGRTRRSLLLVTCGPFRLAFPAEPVRGVVGAGEIVPLWLADVVGLVWWNRKLFAATSLAPLLGLPEPNGGVRGHGVLVQSPAGGFCLLVDEVLDLVDVPIQAVAPLPSLVRRAAPLPGMDAAVDFGGLMLVVDPVRLVGLETTGRLARAVAGFGGQGAAE